MRRRTAQDVTAQDHDSFLDIVANIVGILIILVMVVSVRAKQAPPTSVENETPEIDVTTPRSTHVALQQDVLRLAMESKRVNQFLTIRQQERSRLALMLATTEQHIAEGRLALDQRDRELFDLNKRLAAARAELEKTELARIHAAASEPEAVQVESLPTPISETVFGKEAHFQLRGGRIAYVPIEDLFDEARQQARQKVWKLDKLPEATETVGPMGGFRMRYTLEKIELPLAVRVETGRTGYMIRSKLWELIPTTNHLGEPLQTALADGSQFRRAISSMDPELTTITLWTYPDSFDTFRELKKELFKLGYKSAARPLPDGVRIAGSPRGSRSTAQ